MTLALVGILLLSAAASDPTAPNPIELAGALQQFTGKQVIGANIRAISCRGFEEEPTEVACKWHQRIAKRWRRYSGYLAINGSGWHLIDDPARAR